MLKEFGDTFIFGTVHILSQSAEHFAWCLMLHLVSHVMCCLSLPWTDPVDLAVTLFSMDSTFNILDLSPSGMVLMVESPHWPSPVNGGPLFHYQLYVSGESTVMFKYLKPVLLQVPELHLRHRLPQISVSLPNLHHTFTCRSNFIQVQSRLNHLSKFFDTLEVIFKLELVSNEQVMRPSQLLMTVSTTSLPAPC